MVEIVLLQLLLYESVSSGAVTGITLTNSGNGFTSAPMISITSGVNNYTSLAGGSNYSAGNTQVTVTGGNGSGCVIVPTITSGAISALTISNAGSGYTSTPTISITSGVTNTTALSGGTGYNSSTTQINISGGGGSGAIATATIASGIITAITITNAGTGYTSAPTITISSGINTYAITSGGTGYANSFTVGVSGGGGSGAILTATASGGVITSLTVNNPGSGYTSAPTFDFSAGGGTGANISPKLGVNASVTAVIGSGASANAVVGTGATVKLSGYYTNSKRMRFTLNNALNDVKLSQNARCVVETCNVPSFANLAGKYILLRMVVSSQDKTCDTKKFLNGNPILISMATNALLGSTNVLYNCSEFFYNLNVPTNILSQGYIDMELEVPAASANIDFITNKPLSTFFLNLIIVDEDMELTKDLTLAPPINYQHYNTNMRIRQY